ncbi:MAG: TolC family protein [Bacteroidales bacterium]|nr:TolC family protein [Bacteroidales bacterium]
MMYRTFLFSLIISAGINTLAQKAVTLDECLSAAMKNQPLSGQNEIYKESSSLQQKNINNGKLPQLNLNGQATYQNEVIKLPFSVPGVTTPVVPKAQYKVSLDANQLIYGGGTMDAQNLVEDYSLQLNQLNNDVELYKVRERINQLYFSILLSDLNAGVINNTVSDLNSRLSKVNASIKEGVMLPSAAEVLQAEILKAGQRLLEVTTQKRMLVSTMQVLTGLALNETSTFVEPLIDVDLSVYTNLRPEFGVFGLLQQKLEATKKLSVSKDMPRVYGFGTAGYGNPGYNVFKEGSAFFYTVGAKVTWNFWNWNQTSREKQILDLNSSIIENQKNAYDLANKAHVQQYLADVQKAGELIKSDEQIIELRKSITRSAASQLENGTLTATEFVTEQLAEEQALLNRNLHKMQLLQSKALYKAATGGL